MSSAIKKRKSIPLDMKIEILNHLAAGKGSTAVGKYFGISESTIRTIKKKEDEIRKSLRSATKFSASACTYVPNIIKAKMEKELVVWIRESSQNNVLIGGNAIQQKALQLYRQIKESEPETSSQSRKEHEFTASKGWLSGFKKRHDLHNIKITDNEIANDEFLHEFEQLIGEKVYAPNGVTNTKETVNFRKNTVKRTYALKSYESADDFSTEENRINEEKFENFQASIAKNINDDDSKKPTDFTFVDVSEFLLDKVIHRQEIIEAVLEIPDCKEQDGYKGFCEKSSTFNANTIKEGLELARKLADHFVKNDPNKERARNFQANVESLMAPYRELQRNLAKERAQSLIKEIMSKTKDFHKK